MKKNLLLLLFLICISYLIYIYFNPQSVYDAAGINSGDITKIVFYDGRGGRNKPITIENKQQINEFLKLLDKYIVSEDKDPKLRAGWIHSAVFYKDNDKIMEITFVDPLIINKRFYRVVKGSLSKEKIDRFLKSIYPDYITEL